MEVLNFGLSLFDSALEAKDGDGPWNDTLVPPTETRASIAGYVWAGLAAPSAQLRWEAAHAVLGLCELGRKDVLGHLMSLAEAGTGGPFADSNLPFYRLHSFQWLLIALARAARDFSAILAPLAPRFIAWALNDQSHVMIRLFAARAALALIANGTIVVEKSVAEGLSSVNLTSFPDVESKSYERVRKDVGGAQAEGDDRFYFGLDFGPYWLEPLGRVFALSQNDVEIEALKIIRSEFGYTDKGRWGEDERARRKIYKHEQTYASHGSYPETDNLHFYRVYHASMIVAGRLLATTPTHRDPEWGKQDEFLEWLSGRDLSRDDGRWLADRCDPSPLEWPAWRDKRKGDPDYGLVSPIDFEQALRSGEILNVWGRWSASDSAREQSVHVRSALVSPGRSMALLRALSTAKDVHDYLIPSADAELQIDRSGFVLKGWIEDRRRDRGLDGKDRWSGGAQYPPPMPAAEVIKMMGLETDSDKRVWVDGAKTAVMSSQVWGHLEIRDEDNNPDRGERLQARWDFVRGLLGRVGRDLIVEVQIQRNRRHRRFQSRQDDDERIPTATKLYLIRPDGSVATLCAGLGFGPQAR